MPVYDYLCPLCQRSYSETRSMIEDQKITQCENCHVPVIRKFGVSAVTFNGEGFYTTDKKAKSAGI